MKHVSSEDLRSLQEDLGRLGQEATHRHLLLCRHCRKEAVGRATADLDESAELASDSPEGRTLGRAVAAMQERIGAAWADREKAEGLCAELLAHPAADRLTVLVGDARYSSPALAHRLLDEAEACAPADPKEADHLVALALVVARRLPLPWTGLEREALLGRSRSIEGEAWRVRGEFGKAEAAHQEALRHLDLLPPGSPERADFCRLLSRLRKDQSRDDEALALIARAAELFEDLPETRRVAECRLEQGWMLLGELESAEALPAFEEAAAWWWSPEEFERWLSARHGLALCFADLRLMDGARALVAEMVEVGAGRPRLDQLRVALVEADLAQAMDANEHAAAQLAEAWPALVEEGAIVEGVLAALDLARLYAEAGLPVEIDRLEELLGSIRDLMTPLREVVSFVLSFASLHGVAGVEVLEVGKTFVGRAHLNPELPFRVLQRPERELAWAGAEMDLRRKVASYSGLNEEVAQLVDDEIHPADRRRLAWTAEATMGIRVVFSVSDEEQVDEAVH